jgi:hypothetical protein
LVKYAPIKKSTNNESIKNDKMIVKNGIGTFNNKQIATIRIAQEKEYINMLIIFIIELIKINDNKGIALIVFKSTKLFP